VVGSAQGQVTTTCIAYLWQLGTQLRSSHHKMYGRKKQFISEYDLFFITQKKYPFNESGVLRNETYFYAERCKSHYTAILLVY
jgi:hypothetical protein